MSTTINRAQIFRRAHEVARWRVLSVGKSVKPYRVWFAEALRAEYKKLNQAKLREEPNRYGLPLASCARSPRLSPLFLHPRFVLRRARFRRLTSKRGRANDDC